MDDDDAVPRIGRLEQSEPVHAQCDQPRFCFSAIIGINFGQCQSSTMDAINLGADVDLGAIELTIEGQPYELSLACATVRLEKDNADIAVGSKYRHVLREGQIESSVATTERSGRGYELGGGIEGDSTGKGRGFFRLSGQRKHNREAESKSRVEPAIVLVESFGQDRWSVGGPDGDPRSQTSDLRGPVITSFRDDAMTPLCRLVAHDGSRPVTGRLRIQASPTDFRLRAKRQPMPYRTGPAAPMDSIAEGLGDDRGKFRKRAERAEMSLKERVAALALVEGAKRRETEDPLIDLAERAFAFLPRASKRTGDEE